MGSTTNDSVFFRVPCEFQLRCRRLNEEERAIFQTVSLRPSPYSVLRGDLDTLIDAVKSPDLNKGLIERAFQLLLNIDQRLERLEEDFQHFLSGKKTEIQKYEWVHGELGAGGVSIPKGILAISTSERADQLYLVDLLLPSLPEQRIVATASLSTTLEHELLRFESIHEDDRESIHRFVAARERELLRARASQRNQED